jgi:hypothetical protein
MPKIYRKWIYHPEKEPKIINSNEYDDYTKKGWKDSPASFTKIESFGVDPEDTHKVHTLGEAIEGVKNRINGELNLDIMTKKQLEEYAREHFNVELDRRKKLGDLRDQVIALVEG